MPLREYLQHTPFGDKENWDEIYGQKEQQELN